jgi:hypothetical protein
MTKLALTRARTSFPDAEAFGAALGDGGDDFLSALEGDGHFVIDGAGNEPGNFAFENIAGTGLHGMQSFLLRGRER